MQVQPFSPSNLATTTISATQTAASTALASTDTALNVIRIVNSGPNIVFLTLGTGAQAPTVAAGFPMMAGTVEVFSKGLADHIGTICATSQTATVYVTCGEGQ
jgi:hypothetical protein